MKHLPEQILLLTSCLFCNQLQAKEKADTPNLVFIMADQWRGQAIGYLGVEPVQTPNLDKLAAEGVHFTDAISSYPVSSPARGMLMTGIRSAARLRVTVIRIIHLIMSNCPPRLVAGQTS